MRLRVLAAVTAGAVLIVGPVLVAAAHSNADEAAMRRPTHSSHR